jgi:hypothetical protein
MKEGMVMEGKHPYQAYYGQMLPALKNKKEELQLLGFDAVKEEDIWQCLIKKKWKKPIEDIHIYEIMDDILSLAPGTFLTFTTIEAYKGPSLLDGNSLEELAELFRD